jgi:hypothetical protein
MLLAAIWILPVPAGVRALTLLLAAVDWPVAYALKLGQVGPLLLLLPVAALLDRGQWWAALVPLATSVFLLPVGLAPVLYPIAFWVTLLGLIAMGERDARSRTSPAAAPALAQ